MTSSTCIVIQLFCHGLSQTVWSCYLLYCRQLQALWVIICLFRDLWPEYEYTAHLYKKANIIDADKNPTFFVTMKYSNDLQEIFKTVYQSFNSVWLHLSPQSRCLKALHGCCLRIVKEAIPTKVQMGHFILWRPRNQSQNARVHQQTYWTWCHLHPDNNCNAYHTCCLFDSCRCWYLAFR